MSDCYEDMKSTSWYCSEEDCHGHSELLKVVMDRLAELDCEPCDEDVCDGSVLIDYDSFQVVVEPEVRFLNVDCSEVIITSKITICFEEFCSPEEHEFCRKALQTLAEFIDNIGPYDFD